MKIAKIQRFVCFLGVLLISPNAATQGFTDNEAGAIEAFLQDNFTESNFGFVIGLIDETGSRVFSAGKMDNGTNQRVDGETVFEIGSVTKTFTSLLLLDMVRRGELKLDDPIAKYLPARVKVPTHGGKQITLLNLAVQDSGLPFDADNFTGENWWESYHAYEVEDLYAYLSGHNLTIDPGTKFQYSNIGMSLLGHVMELRSGTDFEALVMNRICDPLRMNSTCINLTPELKTRLSTGHDSNGKSSLKINLKVLAGAGALHSTANDMLKYISAQLGFTKTALTPLMEQTHVRRHEGSAMPWIELSMSRAPGAEFLGHAGGTFGYSTFIGFDKQRRRGVVVLSNQRGLTSYGFGSAILQGLPLTLQHGTQLVREIVGIGVRLDADERTNAVQITMVFPDSPAERAKLSVGLVLKKVDDVSTEGLSTAECVALIKGPEGKQVRLEFLDPNDNKTQTVELRLAKFLTSGAAAAPTWPSQPIKAADSTSIKFVNNSDETDTTDMKHYKSSQWNFALDIPKRWNSFPPVPTNSPNEVIRFASQEDGTHLLIVFRGTHDPEQTLKEVSDRVQQILAGHGFGNFVTAETTIGSRVALTLDFDRPHAYGTWSCRHYFVAEDTLMYTLGFGTNKASMFELFDRMAKSFEILAEP